MPIYEAVEKGPSYPISLFTCGKKKNLTTRVWSISTTDIQVNVHFGWSQSFHKYLYVLQSLLN